MAIKCLASFFVFLFKLPMHGNRCTNDLPGQLRTDIFMLGFHAQNFTPQEIRRLCGCHGDLCFQTSQEDNDVLDS